MNDVNTSRVQSRGQITLPKSVRNEAEVNSGDLVLFKVLGPHRIEIETIPIRPLEYFIQRFRSDEPYDDDAIRKAWHEDAWRDVIGE